MKKDIKLSNLKGLLIVLVVFGHLLELTMDSYYQLFTVIYIFHMPLFIFISGYLAKRVRISKIINLILLYIIFESFFDFFLYLIGEHQYIQFHYGTPQFHLWYIVSLVFWYVLAWFILKLKLSNTSKWLILISIILIGFLSRWFYTHGIAEFARSYYELFDSYKLSYQRTLSFAPFFFAGFFMSKVTLQKIYSFLQSKSILITLLLISMIGAMLYIQNDPNLLSIYRGSYGADWFMDNVNDFSEYVIKMSVYYLLALILCLLVMNMTSKENSILTKWGDFSLTIFLFHPMFVYLLRNMEFMSPWAGDVQLVFFILLTLFICSILGSNWFVRLTKPICNPYQTFHRLFMKMKRNNE